MRSAGPEANVTRNAAIDALSRLMQSLRTIQVWRGDHPWLLLDLTMVQLKALVLLVETEGLRSRELADGLGIAPSATTPLVDRLVQQQLAVRDDDASDRRIIWIRPTAKAVSLHGKLMQTHASVIAEVLQEVPPDQRSGVYRAAQLLSDSARRVVEKKKSGKLSSTKRR